MTSTIYAVSDGERLALCPAVDVAEAIADVWRPGWRDWPDLADVTEHEHLRFNIDMYPQRITWDRTAEAVVTWREDVDDWQGLVYGDRLAILAIPAGRHLCDQCGRPYDPRAKGSPQRYCDAECRTLAALARRRDRRGARRTLAPLTCDRCGTEFDRPPVGRPPKRCADCR